MQGDDGDGVRHAAESLRALHDELPALAEDLDRSIREKVDETTAPLEQAALVNEAHEIRLIGTRMTADREDAFASVAHLLTGAADEIEALLRPSDDGDAPPPVFSLPPPPVPPPSVVTTAQQTAIVQQHLPDADAHQRAIAAVVACFPAEQQQLVDHLLTGRSAHAVERHGQHLMPEQLIARLQWLLDPARVDRWWLNADSSADSWRKHGHGTHQVGTSAGHYTSPEAVAKPLLALLRASGPTQEALDSFLDAKAEGEMMIKVFLRTSDTGITASDVYTQRAPGTDTKDGKKMWQRARRGSMAGHGDAPGVREHDMVSLGKRPGSLIVFVKDPDQPWRLITSYFADDPRRVEYMEL